MKRFLMIFAIACLMGSGVFSASADEGMWLPSQIDSRVREMRKRGFKLRADDLYDTSKPALNRAVVLFGGGCTGAIVSPEGLLFTNHHCGYRQIQKHSSVEHDYLTNGFWAMSRAEELPNPGLEVRILVRMEEVTAAINDGRTRKEIIAEAEQGGRYRADIKPLYYGNEHWMWVYEVFTDVRLVAAPPSAIGKFGGDTDNWIWPRHTGDFSVFRIYASADGTNRPASYSPDNKPYRPARFFEISTGGISEGDFTFVYGFPGTTQEYITSDAVRYTVERSNPMKIALRTLRLNVIREASEADPATRIAWAAKQAGIANAWKKWQGESWGLKRRGTIARKEAEEQDFRRRRPASAWILDSLGASYVRWANTVYINELYNETFRVMDFSDSEIDRPINRRINALMLREFQRLSPIVPQRFVQVVDSLGGYESAANHPEALKKLAAEVWAELGIKRLNSLAAAPEIAEYYKPYMQSLRELRTEKAFYPDANLTLRIAYGSVAGYRYEDAVWHDPMTTLDGVMAKDNPNVYDYDIPTRLRELYAAKDFGRWTTTVDGRQTVPVCFLASNHTSGGNSGSPILNARGQLLGLNFDRTWLGTMSDVEFDPTICRNISVDIRYMMFVIEKVGGAGWILNELTFSK